MDDLRVRQFFEEPQSTSQRRYEAFRAFFMERRPLREIAEKFGYKVGALKVMVSRFRARCNQGDTPPLFFASHAAGRRGNAATRTPTGPKFPPRPIAGPSNGKTARSCTPESPGRFCSCRSWPSCVSIGSSRPRDCPDRRWSQPSVRCSRC